MPGWLAVLSSARAATLTVGPSGQFATVQEAVDAAASGDVVEIGAGTYDAAVVSGISLTLVGVGDETVLTAVAPDTPALSVATGATVTVASLRLVGVPGARGASILQADATFEDVSFADGGGPSGADLLAETATLTLRRCTLTSPTVATGPGGHARIVGSIATLEDSEVANGTATLGGGLYAEASSLVVRGSTFRDNEAELGGGMDLRDTTAVVEDATFSENRAPAGDEAWGGALHINSGSLTMARTSLLGNAALEGGGALDVNYVTRFELLDSLVQGNVAGLGGGIALLAVDSALIGRSTFQNNHADADGGALYVAGRTGVVEIAGNAVCANSADSDSGAIDLYPTYLEGVTPVQVHHNTFVSHSSGDWGGVLTAASADVWFEQNTVASVYGVGSDGALWLGPSTDVIAVNNAFVDIVAGTSVVRGTGSSWLEETYNLYWGAEPEEAVPTAVVGDPAFRRYDPGDCTSDLRPAPGSPLIDAGDPAVLDGDGSRSDIGAYGGPGADAWVDIDGDGVIEGDCDPWDPDWIEGCPDPTGTTEATGTGSPGDDDDDDDDPAHGGAIPTAWFCAHAPGGAWPVGLIVALCARRRRRAR
jgi:hypothetical protein